MSACNRAIIVVLSLALGGCGLFDRRSEPEIRYIPVPEGYLQQCELPAAPVSTGELSEAFVIAFSCAKQGNRDKQRIRDLVNEHSAREE